MPALGDENIRRLDIAVDDSLFVRGIECVRYFHAQLQQQIHGQRLSGNAVLERLAFEMLHDDEVSPVLLANLVNGADVRMIQRGSSPGLALKSLEGVRIACEFFGQKLQGHVAAEARILSLVDHTHASAAELFDDFVMGDDLAGQTLGIRHGAR